MTYYLLPIAYTQSITYAYSLLHTAYTYSP
jgi:hypothetical protein